jgi:NRPS condensation-like uncharacterized protein
MYRKLDDDATASSLWPLDFTAFEYYYYLDDGPTYPTTFPVELRFSGRLEPRRFRCALAAAVARHPLLTACMDDRGRTPRWVVSELSEPVLEWADDDQPLEYPAGSMLDLRKQVGLRTWVRSGAQRSRVVFEFHHACCDGLAGLQFVQDFLALYRTDEDDGAAPTLRPLDRNLLQRRGEIATDDPRPTTPLLGLWDAWYTLKVWAAILFRSPQAIAPPRRTPDSPKRQPLSFEVETLSTDESAQLRQAAKRAGATTNDLLIRDFLLVLRRWNLDHGGRPKGRLRINVPVSVRTRSDAALPAVNRLGYGFVTVNMDDAADPEALLRVVREETRRIKEWKLALYFLGGLAFARNLPGVIPWAMRRRRSFATAVLSNVGRFAPDPTDKNRQVRWSCGDLTLDWIGGVPPLRPLTRAAVVVIDYAGCTSICLRTDPHYFDVVASQELLARFVAQVRGTRE